MSIGYCQRIFVSRLRRTSNQDSYKLGFGLSGSDWDERFALCFFLSLTAWKWAKILPHYDTSSAVPGLIQRRIICSFEQAQDLWRFYWSKTYFLNIVSMVLIRDELEISHLSQIGRCWPKSKHPISQWELFFTKLELLSDPTRKLDVRKFNYIYFLGFVKM